MNNEKEVKVTVICVIYNQERYLEKCLDGIAEQKTNFPFEVILHDDASTDKSPDIIKKYCKQYNDIFVPILQETNQYSKDIPFFKRLLSDAKGEYIALCEGDDYWCDPYKLQKQYDYMMVHPECSMCVHNTVIHDLAGNNPDKKFMNYKESYEKGFLDEKQVFYYWVVHYSSYFIRNNYDILPDKWSLLFWARDFVMLTVAYAHGKIGVLEDTMSVYNSNNQEGLTAQNSRSKDSMKKKYDRAIYLREYLEYYNNISDEIKTSVQNRINAIEEYMEYGRFVEQLFIYIDSKDKSDMEKYEWLIQAINKEKMLKFCTNPSEGLETVSYKYDTKRMFEMVDIFLDSLHSIGDAVHFSFVSWISRMYQSDSASKECLLAISASPENEIGWGIKLKGDSNKRLDLVLQFADEKKLTDVQRKEVDYHRKRAIELVDDGNLRNGVEEVDMALGIAPLNRDLICYKAFILLLLGDKKGCLNEIGIYNQFYDLDDDIMMIYERVQKL